MRKKSPKVPGEGAVPGPSAAQDEQLDQVPETPEPPGESNVDEAIALAGAGQARRIAKPKPVVPPSDVQGDPERPASAPVNARREMPYEDAMRCHDAAVELRDLRHDGRPRDEQAAKEWDQRVAELEPVAMKKSILTEKGWVAMPQARPKEQTRR